MGAPQTLPADFNQWDSAPPTLPADFDKWDQPKSAPASQPSALSRLGQNFLSGLGIGSNEDAKNFFEHPIHSAMNALNAQGELAMKARDAYNKGDYKSAVIHGLNYLVPFIGQQTDKAGEQIAQGDYAGAAGRTLGVVAPIVAGSPEVQAGASDAASAIKNAVTPENAVRAAKTIGKTGLDVASDVPVVRQVLKLKKNWDASAATAPTPRTIVVDPETGAREFSDVVAAKQNAAQVTSQPKPAIQVVAPAPEAQPAPATGTLESRLSALLDKAQSEPKVPEPEEDLTAILQQSIDQIKARKGGVMTTANPAELAKRWGVDTDSLQSGREQTRGMSPEQTEQYVNKLAESYKNGRTVEPVMETRDEANNVIDADGRARVLAAQRAGIERVPIMIRRITKGPQAPTLEPAEAGSKK
jgi:hypothetical protein